MRMSAKLLLLVAAIAAIPAAALAQTGQVGSYNRPKTNNYPTVSPYLNLNRAGSNPAINYYGLVRPQVDTSRQIQQIEQGNFVDPRFPGGAGGVGPDGNPIPGMNRYYPDQTAGLQTGHPATYFYYSHYYQFPNTNRGGAGAGGGGGTSNRFGQPSTSMPFFTGGNGIIMPVNPAGANPLGGGFGAPMQFPGQVVMP